VNGFSLLWSCRSIHNITDEKIRISLI
jgi:hypothetical protein